MNMVKEIMGRKFIGYKFTPVDYGYRPSRGIPSPKHYSTLTEARVEAIKWFNRNQNVLVKLSIEEWYESIYTGFPVEKMSRVQEDGKTTYWIVKENKKKYKSRINPRTGAIMETVKK